MLVTGIASLELCNLLKTVIMPDFPRFKYLFDHVLVVLRPNPTSKKFNAKMIHGTR